MHLSNAQGLHFILRTQYHSYLHSTLTKRMKVLSRNSTNGKAYHLYAYFDGLGGLIFRFPSRTRKPVGQACWTTVSALGMRKWSTSLKSVMLHRFLTQMTRILMNASISCHLYWVSCMMCASLCSLVACRM